MKKKILRFFLTAATVLCCAICASVSVSAARPLEDTIPNCKLYDVDNFLSAEEQKEIDAMIREVSSEIEMYVAVCILDGSGENFSDAECEAYADNLYDKLFNIPYGKETDGEILLLNMPMHAITIENSGVGELYYYCGSADNRNETMRSNLISYMRNSDYVGAVRKFCSDLKYYKDKGIPKNAYTYNEQTKQYAYYYKGEIRFAEKLPWWFGIEWGKWVAIGVIAGAISALIAAAIVKSNYKLVKSLSATNYISQQDTKFYVRDDLFIRTHTTKTRIDTDSRGGGGGGGGGFSHTSSGGFSHSGGTSHW